MKTQPKQTTSSKGSGSYLLEDFSGHEVELKRLQRQANLLPDIEKNALIRQGLKPDHDVLDLACGPGLTSCMIDSCLTTGSVIGVDYDANMIRAAKAISLERGHDIHFSQGDVYQLPEEMNESFDFVYCRFLFQHLQNPEKALQSIYRVLRPGGTVHIMDVNDEWLSIYPDLPAFQKLRELAIIHQAARGGNRLIGKALRNHLLDTGFTHPRLDIIKVDSDMIGIRSFIDITTSFKKEQIQVAEQVGDPTADELLAAIHQHIEEESVFGILGVYSIAGVKA